MIQVLRTLSKDHTETEALAQDRHSKMQVHQTHFIVLQITAMITAGSEHHKRKHAFDLMSVSNRACKAGSDTL